MKYAFIILALILASCDKSVEYHHSDGAKGATGSTGANGSNGSNGAAGTNGSNGSQGPAGPQGSQGIPGSNGLVAGVSCNVHDLPSWSSSTTLPQAIAGNTILGNFTLPDISVPYSNAALGFPGMPPALQALVGVEGYILDCYGYMKVSSSGVYTFKLLSDDGSVLIINDLSVIQNQGLHSPTTVSNAVILYRGLNKINIVYYQGPLTDIALELRWSGPNITEQVVPSTVYVHEMGI